MNNGLTRSQLEALFPNASEGFLRGAAIGGGGGDRKGPGAVLERRAGDAALGKAQTKGADSGKFFVRVTSFRRRLLDEDNLCEKYHVDCCRYAGLLPSDSAAKARIVTTQEKVGSEAEERTVISIERMPP